MLKVILHRPVQACVIAVLSGLVVACAVFTPLYQRALEQASVTVELANAPAAASMLQISSIGILSDVHTGPGSDAPPVSTDELDQLVPRSLRRSFEPPIPSVSVSVIASNGPSPHPEGSLVSRSEACAHLELTTGQCPEGANQIAVSAADADNFGWQPGMRVPVVEKLPDGTLGAGGHGTLTVTGVYRNPTGRYWGGWRLTGYSGTRPDLKTVLHDTWITDQATFAGSATWRNPSTQVDLPLDRAATGFDQLLSLGPKVSALQRQQSTRPSNAPRVQVASELTSLADTVREGSDQARITVPVLMTPLGILGLVVLWMALGAAAEQRRPEVAVARLRGRGVRGARAHLLRELLTVVLAGVPIGVLAALGVAWLARHLALPGDAPLELRLPVWEALLLAVAAVTITTVLVSARVSREPIGALLRRVPPRRVGWALGTADAVALTAAASIVGAFVTGKVTGPVALAAPAVLALAVGLLISRLATPVATRLGRSLLTRGSPSAGVPLLHLARHPGTRSMIALLTVSAAILVFAGDAVAVGARNRDLAAAQQVGAPMVATISDGSLSAVQDAIGSIGPSGTDITPVVVQHATGYDDQTNLFVEPSAFARIAELPASARAPIRALTASGVKPIELTGRHFALLLSTEQLATGAQPVELAMQLLRHDGSLESVALGQLPSGTSAPHTVELAADCAAGCVLTGWQITTNPANSVSGTFTVAGLHADRSGPVALGTPSDWRVPDPDARSAVKVIATNAQSLTAVVDNGGRSDLLLQHSWVPVTLPAAVTGKLPNASGARFIGTGLDGVDRPMRAAARLAWLPQAGRNGSVSDLDLAARAGDLLAGDAALELWFAHADDRTLAEVTKALEARHISVLQVARESRTLSILSDSPSAWSLQLGVLVGVACLLVAALGLAIAAAASWRSRTRDLAILRLNGMPATRMSRIALGEQLPTIVLAVLAGAASGVLAAHFALPEVPLLPSDPQVDLIDLSAAWGTVIVLASLTLLALCGLGWLLARQTARRAALQRVLGAS